MDGKVGRMFLSFMVLFTVPFGIVSPSAVSSAKPYSVSHNTHVRRSLATAKPDINSYWGQELEERAVTEEESQTWEANTGISSLVRVSSEEHYGSFTRKEAKSVDAFGSQTEIQATNSGNIERVFHENIDDPASEESTTGVIVATTHSKKKGKKERGCDVYMKGDPKRNATEIHIQCTADDTLVPLQNISDFTDPKGLPDTSAYGFKVFDQVDGHIYAIHVTPGSRLVIKNLRISGFRKLGAVFLVDNATLEIQNGVVENIFESHFAGVMSVSDAVVIISRCTFKNTHGTHAGVATITNSAFDVSGSYFEDNSGTEESLVFYANQRSVLNVKNSIFLGSLPHTENNTMNGSKNSVLIADFLLPQDGTSYIRENFQVVDADAGVAYLTGASYLTIQKSKLMHFGTMKGMIYLEDNSSLVCTDSSLIHNIAIYGGAIFAQDSYVKVTNVDAARNAASRGGAILLHGSFQGSLEGVTFRNNLAAEGGAFFIELEECDHAESQFLMSIHNCSFISNQAYDHGGAVFTSCVALNITNATFIDNTAWLGGGAIYINSSYVASLKDVIFSGNSAQEGGAVVVHAEITHGNMTIENSAFDGNDAHRSSGGAVMFHGNHSFLSMKANSFSNNRAKNNGGAVSLTYTHELNISDCVFANSTARDGWGGAVHIYMNVEIRIERCKIASGNANQSGGGVFINMTRAVEIHSITIADSVARLGDGGGLALYAVGNITIENTTIHGNFAGSSGGGVGYSNPVIPEAERNGTRLRVDLMNVVLTSNKANYGGGIIVHTIEALEVINSTISNNCATEDGGGIRMHEVSSVNIQNSQMQGNEASKGSGGSVYGIKLQEFVVKSSMFTTSVGNLYGGALYLFKARHVKLDESKFVENEVTRHSGGAITLFKGFEILINDVSFERNTANRSGGAMHLQQPVHTLIISSKFHANIARNEDGGGIYFNTSVGNHSLAGYSPSQHTSPTDGAQPSLEDIPEPVKMFSTEFKDNEAGRHGGGVYLDKLNGIFAMVVKATFEGCKAMRGSGGCAYLANIDALQLEVGRQEYNTAYKDGGCFFLTNIPRVELNDAYFGFCSASAGRGGAFYYDGNLETTNILQSGKATFLNCKAAEGGACHVSNVNELVLDDSEFWGNSANRGSGGCMIATNVKHASVKPRKVHDNEASTQCGAMCLTHVDVLEFSGSFTSNMAGSSHGGVAWLSDVNHTTIEGSKFAHNRGGGFGGALHMTRILEAHISSTTFESNKAGLDGGGVSVSSFKNLSILNSNFNGNTAKDGGGLHISKSQSSNSSLVQVRDNVFRTNKAEKNGGGAVVNDEVAESPNSLISHRPSLLTADFLNCLFEKNRARNGGGLGALAGDIEVMNSSFVKNNAGGSGGALYINDGDFVVVNNSRMERNHADKGGAVVITCNSNVNFTYTLVRRNTAPRRDDGALVSCGEANLFLANVTLIHNFRDHDWYYYILIPVCSYCVLVAFLFLGIYSLRTAFLSGKQAETLDTYSDIGEYDPSATDLMSFFAEPAMEVESDDEAIVAPKPSPSDPEPRSSHPFLDTVHQEGEAEIDEESDEESLPLPPHRYPRQV